MSTLRQKLLADAKDQLREIELEVRRNLDIIAGKYGLNGLALAKLVATKRVDSIRASLVQTLANNAEKELVELYNQQQDALTETDDDNIAKIGSKSK